jgi:hypothetical protein
MSAPFRFLAAAVAGWTGFRLLLLMPDSVLPPHAAAEAPTRTHSIATQRVVVLRQTPSGQEAKRPQRSRERVQPADLTQAAPTAEPAIPAFSFALAQAPQPWHRPTAASAARLASRPGLDRWSVSTWLLVRRDGGSALASGGTLGGSQAGFRIGYRLGRPLELSARVSSPLGNRRGTGAAFGLDWRPSARLPLNLLVERRQGIGRGGRNAFALTLHGGVYRRLAGDFRLDAYAQAGIVGARSRDLFADGGARLGVPIRGIEVGASVSGGAQPGVSRLDLGPQVTLRLPGERLRLTAEWRFRIAGEARPGSGPTLTLAGDF